jgi:hypothetical protein
MVVPPAQKEWASLKAASEKEQASSAPEVPVSGPEWLEDSV